MRGRSAAGCTWYETYGCWSSKWDDTSKDESGDQDKDGETVPGKEDTGKTSSFS